MTYLQLIDTNTPGPRDDVTPLFGDYEAFSALVNDLLRYFDDNEGSRWLVEHYWCFSLWSERG